MTMVLQQPHQQTDVIFVVFDQKYSRHNYLTLSSSRHPELKTEKNLIFSAKRSNEK